MTKVAGEATPASRILTGLGIAPAIGLRAGADARFSIADL